MCFPSPPKEDPQVKAQRKAQKEREQARVTEEKQQIFLASKERLKGRGVRSLITGRGRGYGGNYRKDVA